MLPVTTSMFKSFDIRPLLVGREEAMLSRGPTEWIIVDRISARRREDVTDFPFCHFPHRPLFLQRPLHTHTPVTYSYYHPYH
jgi:hypothetical protein